MFIDDQYTKFVDEGFPGTGEIRRIENGSIDYDHYLKIGREARGAAFREAGRSSKGLFRRIFDTLAIWRQASQEVEQSTAPFVLVAQVEQRGEERNDSDYQGVQSLAEAA